MKRQTMHLGPVQADFNAMMNGYRQEIVKELRVELGRAFALFARTMIEGPNGQEQGEGHVEVVRRRRGRRKSSPQPSDQVEKLTTQVEKLTTYKRLKQEAHAHLGASGMHARCQQCKRTGVRLSIVARDGTPRKDLETYMKGPEPFLRSITKMSVRDAKKKFAVLCWGCVQFHSKARAKAKSSAA